MNDNIIMLNQEKYVNQLNKKIEKLDTTIIKYKEELINKESEISESNEKLEEFKNNLDYYKNIFKLEFKKQMDQKNEKLILLNKELEIKNYKLKNFEKKYSFLQEKYLKTLNEKKILDQENIYKQKKTKLLKSSFFDKKVKLSHSKEDFFGFINSTNNKNELDTIRTRYKDTYDNNLIVLENDDIKKKENKEIVKSNILPNINLSRSRFFDKDEEQKEKNLKVESSNFSLKEKNEDSD